MNNKISSKSTETPDKAVTLGLTPDPSEGSNVALLRENFPLGEIIGQIALVHLYDKLAKD